MMYYYACGLQGEHQPPQSLPSSALRQAAFLVAVLGNLCCINLASQNYILQEMRKEISSGNASFYCADPSVFRWLWGKLEQTLDKQIMWGYLSGTVMLLGDTAAEPLDEDLEDIFKSKRGIQMLVTVVGEGEDVPAGRGQDDTFKNSMAGGGNLVKNLM